MYGILYSYLNLYHVFGTVIICTPAIYLQSCLIFPVLNLLFLSVVGVCSWVNEYDKPFSFTCPQHQSISRIVSHHDNRREDRVFDFTCSKYTEFAENCTWSGTA